MLAKLILDPTEGIPTLQEFAKRCQKIADISDKLESLGWEIDSDLSYEPFVVASPPQDIENEDELQMLLEALEINYTDIGYLDTEEDSADDDLEEDFENEDFYDDDLDFDDDDDEIEGFCNDEDILGEEAKDSLVGRTITNVECFCDCLTFKFEDGGQLVIEGCDAFLE